MEILSKFWIRLLDITKLIIGGLGIKLGVSKIWKELIIGGWVGGFGTQEYTNGAANVVKLNQHLVMDAKK